jgi:arylsulfatase A-like enzyme
LWQDSYKYVFNGFDRDELYNLETDPYELENLAHKPENRSTLAQMAGRMWQTIRDTGDDNMLNAQYGMFRFAPVGPEEQG